MENIILCFISLKEINKEKHPHLAKEKVFFIKKNVHHCSFDSRK